jgi:predicted HTH transcriptional regulator
VTIERITSLAATTGTEPLTVDFKEKATPRLAECVASMANAHGGLIFVGITDTDRKIVGVKTETMAHVATCSPPASTRPTGCRRCSRSLSARISQASTSW